MFGDRLSTDGHIRGEGCRGGVAAGNEKIEQLAPRRIRHRFPEVVVVGSIGHGDDACPEAKRSRKRSPLDLPTVAVVFEELLLLVVGHVHLVEAGFDDRAAGPVRRRQRRA